MSLNIEDNFFSQQNSPTSTHPGRRYLGICAPGRRLKAAIIRVYLAVLASSQTLYEQYGEKADPWMTLVGYFNSLRELGGTRRLVDDDISNRLRQMEKRGLANLKNELEVKLDRWLSSISSLQPGTTLDYQSRSGTAIDLIKPAGQGVWDDFTCLNSLRNVEPTIGLILNDLPLSEENSPLPQPFNNES